ncbi:adenylate kinase [soil metagenome]
MSGKRYLVLMGPPGAGKGTQASRVAEQGGLCKISTGDLLRAAVAAGSELGRKAEQTMKAGELVPDDVILGLVDEVLDRPECSEGAVFDGFPRTVDQAEGLQGLLSDRGARLDQVLIIEVPEAEIVRRLSGRRVCKKCGKLYHISFDPSRKDGVCDACGGELVQRPDDQPETIARRLTVYDEETAPVREHYAARTGVTAIDGDQPIDAVIEAIRRELEPADAEG